MVSRCPGGRSNWLWVGNIYIFFVTRFDKAMRMSRLDKAQGHLSPLTIASLSPLDPPGSIPLQYASHQELSLEINKLHAGLPASELRDQLAVPFKVLLLRHLRAESVLIGRRLHFYIYISPDPTGWGPVMSIPPDLDPAIHLYIYSLQLSPQSPRGSVSTNHRFS